MVIIPASYYIQFRIIVPFLKQCFKPPAHTDWQWTRSFQFRFCLRFNFNGTNANPFIEDSLKNTPRINDDSVRNNSIHHKRVEKNSNCFEKSCIWRILCLAEKNSKCEGKNSFYQRGFGSNLMEITPDYNIRYFYCWEGSVI